MSKGMFWSRSSNKLYTIAIQRLKEKEFISEEGQSLRYMYFSHPGSRALAVGFQACNDSGPRYNYVKTIKDCPVNRLFIKDDFAPNRCGDYYLGCNGTYSVERAVYELIERYIDRIRPEKVIFFGSSKGGYAALNFGLHYPGADMIIGAPQYRLASYMDGGKWKENLEELLGGPVTEENKAELDRRLQRKIQEDKFADTQTVYFHYSNQEHTYEEHIADLLEDLKQAGVAIHEDIESYTVHEDLRYFFPRYLRDCIMKIV